MKNLQTLLKNQARTHRKKFVNTLSLQNSVADILSLHLFKQYFTPAKLKKFTGTINKTEVKKYLISRYDEKQAISFDKQIKELQDIFAAGDLIRLNISVTWAKNTTWGSNPTAEVWAQYDTPQGIEGQTYYSRSIGGCGYDKLSTAVAEALNQVPELKKVLYTLKNKKPIINNRDLFGYGAGYHDLPYFEGGVGIECFPKIFAAVGFKMTCVISTKSSNVYTVEKMK